MNSERELVLGLLRLGNGMSVDLFAMLSIMQMEDGNFGVYYDPDGVGPADNIEEWLFDDAEQATDFFINKRHELQLGYDYEIYDDVNFYKKKSDPDYKEL